MNHRMQNVAAREAVSRVVSGGSSVFALARSGEPVRCSTSTGI